MLQQRFPRALPALSVAVAMLIVAACKTEPTKPDANAAPVRLTTVGPILLPGGIELSRARLVAQARKSRIYTVLLGIGDRSNEKLLFSPEMARALGLTAAQMQRRFIDTVGRSKRFELFDSTSTVTAEASDIVLDGMFTSATQEIQTIEGGVRVAVTRVRLSMQMKDRYSGQLLFPAPVEVVGQTGRSTGDRVVLGPNENPSNPEVQRRLANDYEHAMQRAFVDAAARIEAIMKPMGQVIAADGDQVGIIGGFTNGLQRDDEMVVFRASTAKVGDTEVFALIRPVVAVHCDSVGEKQSQCTVVRRADAAARAQPGDYAVLTDGSAKGVREY